MEIRAKRILQLALLSLAIGMIVFGIYRGEVATVFTKAVNICLECIGLG